MTLERWCAAIARAYPEPVRAAEVRTTLLESNDGRRRPRLGDVADVVWHGVVTRLRGRAPGTSFGALGDALAVVLVTWLLVQTITIGAVVARMHNLADWEKYTSNGLVEFAPAVLWGAIGLVLLAAAATAAACLGRVALTRVLTTLTALVVLAGVVTGEIAGGQTVFASRWIVGAMAGGGLTLYGVLFTGAVARAARVVPRWWWGMAAVACGVVAAQYVDLGRGRGYNGRAGIVLGVCAIQVVVLFFLSLSLAGTYPRLVMGQALLAVPGDAGPAAAPRRRDRVTGAPDGGGLAAARGGGGAHRPGPDCRLTLGRADGVEPRAGAVEPLLADHGERLAAFPQRERLLEREAAGLQPADDVLQLGARRLVRELLGHGERIAGWACDARLRTTSATWCGCAGSCSTRWGWTRRTRSGPRSARPCCAASWRPAA